MRLIDADKLFLHLNDWAFAEAPTDLDVGEVKFEREVIYKTIKDCMRAVDDQPTAYDVDKVVEEIEAFGGCAECREKGTDKRFYYGQGCKACLFGKIVGIVKRGGTDEEDK